MDEIEELPASRTSSSPRSVSELCEEPVWQNAVSLEPCSADTLLDDTFTPFVQCSPVLACGIVVLVILILAILVVVCVQETIH